MKTGLFIGRFQPFHEGHRACIEKILEECEQCIILVRSVPVSENNPIAIEDVIRRILNGLGDLQKRVTISIIYDAGCDLTVYKGRKVGWQIKKLKMPKKIKKISATKIRKDLIKKHL